MAREASKYEKPLYILAFFSAVITLLTFAVDIVGPPIEFLSHIETIRSSAETNEHFHELIAQTKANNEALYQLVRLFNELSDKITDLSKKNQQLGGQPEVEKNLDDTKALGNQLINDVREIREIKDELDKSQNMRIKDPKQMEQIQGRLDNLQQKAIHYPHEFSSLVARWSRYEKGNDRLSKQIVNIEKKILAQGKKERKTRLSKYFTTPIKFIISDCLNYPLKPIKLHDIKPIVIPQMEGKTASPNDFSSN